jgi:hypothetical protein
MPALTRKFKKIFGINSANNGVFGSKAAGTPANSTNPETIESLAAFLNGWGDATQGGLKLPTLEDMQGLKYDTDYHLAYIYQTGMQVYNSQTTYYTNDLVRKDATTEIWKSLINDNIGNALVSGSNWALIGNLSYLPIATLGTAAYVNTGASSGDVPLIGTTGYLLKSVQIFTSSGVWTKPANINAVMVKLVGGGGSGGNSTSGGTGGGGGGYSEKFITSGLGATETITVGLGGTAATNGNNGNTGGTTSFGAHCSATGGSGGKTSNGVGTGTGGTGSGGSINIQGSSGGLSISSSLGGDGGGSQLSGRTSGAIGSNAGNGILYGGGSGGANGGIGGAGAAGVIIVYEYI